MLTMPPATFDRTLFNPSKMSSVILLKAEEMLSNGKSPETVREMMKRKASGEEDKKSKLEKEKQRLEKSISELEKRLEIVEEHLASM